MTAREAAVWRAQQRLIQQQSQMQQGYQRTGQAARRTGQQIRGADRAGAQAFGSAAVSQVRNYITGLVGIQGAISEVKKLYQDLEQTVAQAAERNRASRMGLG
jgi:hypothetical protein